LKILFVKLKEPTRPGQKAVYTPPIGLWSLRAALRVKGHTVKVIDMHLGDEISGRWDLIGISAQFSIQHAEYVRVAEIARQHAERVIAGGFHAAAVPPPDGIDDVCTGAGEQYFDVPYTPPDVTVEEMGRYWQRGAPHDLTSVSDRWMTVETSRGCEGSCGFCGVRSYWGSWIDLDVVPYLRRLSKMGVEELYIEDDNATAYGRLSMILPKLSRFAWSMPNGVRAADLTSELIHDMAMSGCWRLSLPFETGTRRGAELMHLGSKWLPHYQALEVVKRIRGEGVLTCGFFIIGYPGETRSDVMRTLEYANSLPLDDRHIYIATPYPGTPLYNLCRRAGYLICDGPELYERLMYNRALICTPWLKPGELEEIRAEDREQAIRRRATG